MARLPERKPPGRWIDNMPPLSEEERKKRFPRFPPPDWIESRKIKGMTEEQKEKFFKENRNEKN